MRSSNISRLFPAVLILTSAALAQDRTIVRTIPAPSKSIWSIASKYGATVEKTVRNSGNDSVYVLTVPSGNLAALRKDKDVQSAETDSVVNLPLQNTQPDKITRPANATTQTSLFGASVWTPYVTQPAAGIIRIDDSRRYATGAGIVGIIDTGADLSHPALSGALISGFDFTRGVSGGDEGADVTQEVTPILDERQEVTPILDGGGIVIFDNQDDQGQVWDKQEVTPILDSTLPSALGHGTMTAGLVHLVAPTASIMPLKAFKSDGSGSISDVIAAIYWAVDNGANVISMSFDSDASSQELKQAINYANSKKVVLVAAAGNDGSQVVVYPAGYQNVLGVGSTSNSDTRSSFSNYGSVVALAAPGEAIISTYPHNHYAMGWGTSFSTPMVSGAAALLVQLDSKVNPQKIGKALQQDAPVSSPGLGSGRLDLVRACVYFTSH